MNRYDWDNPKRRYANAPQTEARIKGRPGTKKATRPGECPACGGYWRRGDKVGMNYHHLGVTHHYCLNVPTRKAPGHHPLDIT